MRARARGTCDAESRTIRCRSATGYRRHGTSLSRGRRRTARNTMWERTISRADLPGTGRCVILEAVTDARGWRALRGRRTRGAVEGLRDRPQGAPWDPWVPRTERLERLRVGMVLVDAGELDNEEVWRAWRVLPTGPLALEHIGPVGASQTREALAELLERDLETVFAAAATTLGRTHPEQAKRLKAATSEWDSATDRTKTPGRRKHRRRGKR